LLVGERDHVGTYNVLFRHRGVILITAISEVIPVGRHAMVNSRKYSPELWSISSVTRGSFGWSKTTPACSFATFAPNFLKIVDAGRKRHATSLPALGREGYFL
jgi:hypothetical protein